MIPYLIEIPTFAVLFWAKFESGVAPAGVAADGVAAGSVVADGGLALALVYVHARGSVRRQSVTLLAYALVRTLVVGALAVFAHVFVFHALVNVWEKIQNYCI